jgi:DNA-directed RNA polymerase subunit N (RpoN/RPB10)
MDKAIKFYSVPQNICSCRDNNGDFTKISKNFRKFYEEIKKEKKGSDILTEAGNMRSCCRIKFLAIPLEPMLDRSTERFIDNTVSVEITKNTRDLLSSSEPPMFPSLI